MTVNRPWTCSPTAAVSATAAISAEDNHNYWNAPFARASEADRNCAPRYSWPPHLYQDNSRIEERWSRVNHSLRANIGDYWSPVCCRPSAATGGTTASAVAGTGTPPMGDHLKEFLCIEQFTRWKGKFRLNLSGNLISHAKAYVGRKRTPAVQERLDECKLLWGQPLGTIACCRGRWAGLG